MNSLDLSARVEIGTAATACRCGQPKQGAAMSAGARRLSSHRTSVGQVVYYRCACGRPGFALLTPR